MEIAVVDYGLSNLLSVESALRHLGANVKVSGDPGDILKADAVILPGVGAFGDGMEGLKKHGLDEALKEKAASGTPLLGICLGMQMLFDESDEFGIHRGLGLIPGKVEKIPSHDIEGNVQIVPNVGWSALIPPAEGVFGTGSSSLADTFMPGVDFGDECYFVHSYEAKPAEALCRIADISYGGRNVCAAVQKDNVIGTQFHPEKSGPVGLSILEGFLIYSGKTLWLNREKRT